MPRTAIVTGAGSGIGHAAARLLLNRGWRVIGVDKSESALTTARNELAGLFETQCCDIDNSDDVRAAFGRLLTGSSGLDALVCCAGVLRVGALESMRIEEFDKVFSTNTRGSWLCAREAIPALRLAKGRIVFVASTTALRPKVGAGAYSASKAALVHLARVLAVELATDSILVNAVAPGTVDTPMIRVVKNEARTAKYRPTGVSPLGRVAQPEDVARVIGFLLTEDAGYINGATIAVDGGAVAALDVGPYYSERDPLIT